MNFGDWTLWKTKDGATHIVPNEDFKKHTLTPQCWCRPSLDAGTEPWVHNALDQRDLFESGLRRAC